MDIFIWPSAKLEWLLHHPEPTVQEWATGKLFQLYPQRTADLLPEFLRSESPALVLASLAHLDKPVRENLIPLLRKLYMEGLASISARAIRVLGEWQVGEAVAWMQERILLDPPLGREQILAMIYALGRLPGDEAYRLLKHTETGIQDQDFDRWDLFYAALLQHRRREDAATLVQMIGDAEQPEKRRRDALGLLLAQLDPGLNPAEVFFANHSAVQKHALDRLQELTDSDVQEDREALLKELGQLLGQLAAERMAAIGPALQKILAALEAADSHENDLCQLSMQQLTAHPGTDRWSYGLAIVAVSAMLTILQRELTPPPAPDAPWPEILAYLLANHVAADRAAGYQERLVQTADRAELTARLADAVNDLHGGWGALRALDMLGQLQAVGTTRSIMNSVRRGVDDIYRDRAQRALTAMGPTVIPQLLPFLTASPAEKSVVLGVLGQLPTRQAVEAILAHLPALYDECPEVVLQAVEATGCEAFLPFLENEYRPGSWELAHVYVQVCRTNQLQPPALRQIEQDLQHSRALLEENRRLLRGESTRWPEAVYLELACRECGKRYVYAIGELHLHPQAEAHSAAEPQDMTPYRQGVVIVDDLQCKNCSAVNAFVLTEKSLSQLTTESIKLVAFQKGGVAVPGHYPLKHVQVTGKDGTPLTLMDVEQQHSNAVRLSPAKPATHLALGKFYEYVKRPGEARRAYLQSLDLDSRAVEAMAGLARLDAAAGKPEAALQWIESCYDNLDKGRLYLADDAATFKKVVREKRREFARRLGVKVEDQQVDVRFRVDLPDYPKNRPCPCGSGKKYKLCCMKS